MRRQLFSLALAVVSAAGVVGAQEAATATPAHNTFTLMGCLESTPNATGRFTLTRAEALGQAPPARTSAQPDAVGTSGKELTYELLPISEVGQSGTSEQALKAQVGKRVLVTVRPIETAAPASTSTVKLDSPALPPSPERFSVTAIARIDGTCS